MKLTHDSGMKKQEYADIVVLGGGAIGSAIAYYLAKEGRDVLLLERGEFPNESSKRCDGHVATYDSAPGFFSQFCRLGQEMFPIVAKDLPCDIEFEPEGLGLLVDDENDMETALKNFKGKQEEGSPVTMWDQSELRYHEPNVADHVLACINFMGDAKLNPMRLAFGLAHRAQEYGARILPETTITDIGIKDNKVVSVSTSNGIIKTNNVINACGVWAPSIGAMAGVSIPVIPRQGQILVTERVDSLVGKNYAEFGYLAAKGGAKRPSVTPEMEEYGVAFVTEPTAAGTVLIGSSRRYVGMNTTTTPAVLNAIAQRSTHFFPAYRMANVIRSYAGVRPATPDGKPILSKTSVSGFFVAAGHEGNGIGLSLITGKIMSDMLCGQEQLMDVSPLGLDRFSSTVSNS